MRSQVMEKCPHCDVELDARLVADIKNPAMAESCPRRKPRGESVTVEIKPPPGIDLATLMLIGHYWRRGLS